jgi:glyoxylase-like metal-dependent hydrolase (beta-lactamase superfamily II)
MKDTLFIGSCGRVDLPESDPDAMLESLAKLSHLPSTCKVLPGHNYASLQQSTIGREQQTNFAMRDALNHLSPNATSASTSIRSSYLPDYLAAAKHALNKETM